MGTIQRQQELSSGQRSEPSEKVLNVAVWGRELRQSAGITVIFPCLLLFAIHIGRLRSAAVDFKENLIMITAQEDGMVHHVVDVHLQPGMYTQSRRNSSLETSASWRFNLR